MTTEEIEKAAKEEYLSNPDYSVKELVNTFVEGAKFANQHWQEKTRWVPIEERLPVFEGKRRTIVIKTDDDLYAALHITQEVSLSDFLSIFTQWKEIE